MNRPRPVGQRVGFTLVEIMIAMTVLAILVALSAPRAVKAIQDSRTRQARSDVQILASAVRQLVWDTGMWPSGVSRTGRLDAETWDLNAPGSGLMVNTGAFKHWRGPYCAKLENDPWGSPYFFDPDYYVGASSRVVVGSFGPNRRGRNVYDNDNVIEILDL